MRDGVVKYEVNRANPLFIALYQQIGTQEQSLLEDLLSQIECYLPQGRIMNDKYDSINIANNENEIEESRLIDQIVKILSFIPDGMKEQQLRIMLDMEAYKKAINKVDEIVRRLNSND